MSYDPNKSADVVITDDRPAPEKAPVNPTRIDAGRQSSAEPPFDDVDKLKASFCDGLPENDAFREWARHTPNASFARWSQMVFEQYAKETWDRATAVIASLRGGRKRFSERITMAELEASPAFRNLSAEDQRTAKWIITNQESPTLRARSAAKSESR